AASLCLLVSMCQSYSLYQEQIPNGNKVPHPCKKNYRWPGVGHNNSSRRRGQKPVWSGLSGSWFQVDGSIVPDGLRRRRQNKRTGTGRSQLCLGPRQVPTEKLVVSPTQ
ncbi:unnamed protein product, partial [Candidula unifasciata]